MKTNDLIHQFIARWGDPESAPSLFFAPGRVNLIGEHTDYNGGLVLPCAIQFGTWLAIRITNKPVLRLASGNFPFSTEINLEDPLVRIGNEWVNYPLGVVDEFKQMGIEVPGLDLYVHGDIPPGAGLSSSASIEVVTAFALNELLQAGLSDIELIKLSQRAENLFVGVNCGIMDQFAVCLGKKDHALLLNCLNLDYQLVPMQLEGIKLMIANTNKARTLAGSKYNERVKECAKALKKLQPQFPVQQLGEISYMQFYKVQHELDDPVIRSRARHVISENQRVLNAVAALRRNDILGFGSLMNTSHDSLRENYKVTGFELDTLVEAARKINGVLGSRMTGAGFGGCTISLIREEILDEFKEKVGAEYFQKTGLKADFWEARISNGVREIKP
jgi:galactokinase